MTSRRSLKQATTLQDRLIAFAKEAREKAFRLPAGQERRDLLRKARQTDNTAEIDKWLNSPGLQTPTR